LQAAIAHAEIMAGQNNSRLHRTRAASTQDFSVWAVSSPG